MTIIFKDGVYTVNSEQSDRTELVKEMALAIHQLSHEESGDYKSPSFEQQGGKPEFS